MTSRQAAQELTALQHLHAAVAGTADVAGVQECIGTALTETLGFAAASVGLVDETRMRVGAGGASAPGQWRSWRVPICPSVVAARSPWLFAIQAG